VVLSRRLRRLRCLSRPLLTAFCRSSRLHPGKSRRYLRTLLYKSTPHLTLSCRIVGLSCLSSVSPSLLSPPFSRHCLSLTQSLVLFLLCTTVHRTTHLSYHPISSIAARSNFAIPLSVHHPALPARLITSQLSRVGVDNLPAIYTFLLPLPPSHLVPPDSASISILGCLPPYQYIAPRHRSSRSCTQVLLLLSVINLHLM
jgi:hypothetical protein